jgi:hypothetical protein
MIAWCGHIGKQAKKRGQGADIRTKKQARRVKTEPDRSNKPVATAQRPKNNHNRMITGIGTPTSQSKIPRPIFASMIPRRIKNAKDKGRFLRQEQKAHRHWPVSARTRRNRAHRFTDGRTDSLRVL